MIATSAESETVIDVGPLHLGGLAPQRTQRLNDRMRAVVPSICTERARIVTESDRATAAMPAVLRRAHALRAVLEKMSIFIDDEELIVGNHASRPRSAPIFPEFGSLSKRELDLMPIRKVDTLQITEEDKRILLDEVYPYWENRSTEACARFCFAPDVLKVLDSDYRPFDSRSRARSGYGHYLPDIQMIIEKGFISVQHEAERRLVELDIAEPRYSEKKVFYEAMLVVIEGVIAFQNRYADLAEQLVEHETDSARCSELRLIASTCRQVPYHPARSFIEAAQAYWFTLLIDYCAQNGSAISGGRLDQFMYPFYRHDLDTGVLTRAEATTILQALWVKHLDIIKAGTASSARNNGGFATTIALTIGGVDADGRDAVNELSYLCLDAEEAVFNSEPNVSIRVSSVTPDAFIDRTLEVLVKKEGGKDPFFNDDVIIEGLVTHREMTLMDARNWAIVGCVEPTGYGDTMGRTNSCYFNLAKCLELALNDGRCPLSGEQLGPHTGRFEDMTSFEEVEAAYSAQVDHFVTMMISSLNSIELIQARTAPHIYCSMLLTGCMESGRDCTDGGACYDFAGVNGCGLADVADSLGAIRSLVFETKTFSAEELMDALRSDFADLLARQRCLNVPKYGNDNAEADDLVGFVASQYAASVDRYSNAACGRYVPGLFTLSSNTPLGRQVGALPNGRNAKVPLADGGISPEHGVDVNGPTAVVKSVSSWDHTDAVNGVCLNMRFLPSLLREPSDRAKLVTLVRSYFALGGMHIQFNILSSETLLAAQREPEKYRGLVVRVAGYSAFFVELDRDVQNEIISRTIQEAV